MTSTGRKRDRDGLLKEKQHCILHVAGIQHGNFTPFCNMNTSPSERLSQLHIIRDKQLLEPQTCMENVCLLIPDSLEDIDLETTGFHRGCYQAFTKKPGQVKKPSNRSRGRSNIKILLQSQCNCLVSPRVHLLQQT